MPEPRGAEWNPTNIQNCDPFPMVDDNSERLVFQKNEQQHSKGGRPPTGSVRESNNVGGPAAGGDGGVCGVLLQDW
jgi:hypothetical protein